MSELHNSYDKHLTWFKEFLIIVNLLRYGINSINCNVEKKIQYLIFSLILSLDFHLLESLIQRRERFCYIDKQFLRACIFIHLVVSRWILNFPNTF